MRKLLYMMMTLVLLLSFSCMRNENNSKFQNACQLIDDKPDSVLVILENVDYESLDEEDKARFGLLFTSAMYRCSRKMDSDTLIDRSISFYQENGNMADLANSYYYKGCADYARGELKGSIRNFKKAEHLIDNCDKLFANKLYERLAYANFHSGCIDLALKYSKSFLDNSVELADSELISRSLATVASCYYQLGKKDSAQYAINQYLSGLHTVDKELHAEILAYLAQLCFDAGDDHHAELYADSALSIRPQPFANYVKGLVANRKGNTEETKTFFEKALDTDDEQLKILLYGRMASLQASQKQFEEAYQAKKEELRMVRQQEKRVDTEKIAELQSLLDAEQSKRMLYQKITFLLVSTILLFFAFVLLWQYHQKKKHDYEKEIADYTDRINDYVAKLGTDSETINDYENRLTETVSQIGNLEKELALLQDSVNQLQISEKTNKKEIESKTKQIQLLRQSIIEELTRGCKVYFDIKAKKSDAHISETELENMIEFYKIFKISTYNKWNEHHSNLTVRQMVFLALTEMGLKDAEMAQILNVTENAIRTMRSRLNKQYKP